MSNYYEIMKPHAHTPSPSADIQARPNLPLSIANLFTVKPLIQHSSKHTTIAPTDVPPSHLCGSISTPQYKSLTENLALVCNFDVQPGHIMAIALQDVKEQRPQVIIAINQAYAGHHRHVLEKCKSMLEGLFKELQMTAPGM